MGIVFIEFLFDELLLAVSLSKGGSLFRLGILFLLDCISYVLEQ